MNVIQRNNKLQITRFSNVGIGQTFSLGVGGTPLVKITNRSFGIVAPSFFPTDPSIDIGGVKGPGTFVPYYNPPIAGITPSSTRVYDPDSNPLAFGGSSIPADSTVIEQDPPYYLGQSSYLMSGVANANNTVSLSWQYPNFKLGFNAAAVHIKNIVLQRSTSTRKTPYGPTGDGAANAYLNTSQYAAVLADPEWTTLINESMNFLVTGAPPYAITDSYTDTPPITGSSHVFHYRLIIFVDVNPNFTPIILHYELDFNSVTIVTEYTLNVTNNSGYAKLDWSTPSTPELQSLSRLFLNSSAATRAATLWATTLSGFTMPAADGVTRSGEVTINRTNTFLTAGQLNGYVMSGVGVVRIERGNSSNTIRVVNPGYAGNASPGSTVTANKTISSTTELTWVFDLPTPPTNYTLQKSTDGVTYSNAVTLAPDFVQPFRDEDPPNPTIYYRLLATMPANSEGVPYIYVLTYAARSVS